MLQTTTTLPPTTTTTVPVAAVLAYTGSDETTFAAWGVALVLVGMFLVVLSAGRRGRHAR
jgi:hypothetical protein